MSDSPVREKLRACSLPVLRIGLGITFVWIGAMILQDPRSWGFYLQPWVVRLLPIPPAQFMQFNGVFNVIVGIWLFTPLFTWLAAGLAALHIAGVLVGSGITEVTVRDVGLLAATVALFLHALPGYRKK